MQIVCRSPVTKLDACRSMNHLQMGLFRAMLHISSIHMMMLMVDCVMMVGSYLIRCFSLLWLACFWIDWQLCHPVCITAHSFRVTTNITVMLAIDTPFRAQVLGVWRNYCFVRPIVMMRHLPCCKWQHSPLKTNPGQSSSLTSGWTSS